MMTQAEQTKAINERIEGRLTVLRAIRDGKRFSKADKVLRPLLFGDLITVEYLGPTTIVDKVKLTTTGKTYLAFYEMAK